MEIPKIEGWTRVYLSKKSEAEAVRKAFVEFAMKITTEPIEVLLLGREPLLEVIVRPLVGGRPQTWMCGCGAMGMEEEMKSHTCRGKQ